ncbi:MAG: hypothetical protein R3336_03340, partial [Phycisphaeraceae bacterium]|nr:hypothetical protein [Phycisphaeraceae bacterium]
MPESEQPVERVILVGHCGPDSYMLKSVVSRWLPEVEVEDPESREQVVSAGPDTLLLVNRVLEGAVGTGPGVELIAEATGENGPRAML